MKKLFTISVLTLLFFLTSCTKAQPPAEDNQSSWGVKLETTNVTPSGLTIICTQSGEKNISELQTGSYYVIQKLKKTGWVDVKYLPHEYDVTWTCEAWIIPKEDTTSWDVNWEWLYGSLRRGHYRIGKEIMNFHETGNYEIEMTYAEFEIP